MHVRADGSRWAGVRCAVVLGLLWGAGCAPDQDVSGLSVVATVPEADGIIAANLPISIQFSDHIAPEITFGGRVSLTTADLDVVVQAGYDPVSKSVVAVPTTDLLVGRVYTLTLAVEGLVSVDGRTLDEDVTFDFVVGTPTPRPRARPAVNFATEVAPLFAGRCSCHGTGQALPPLTPGALVDQPSVRDPDRTLVRPGDPRRSLLVQKVLTDYRWVPGGPMPPSGALSAEDQRLIVGWVEGLRP